MWLLRTLVVRFLIVSALAIGQKPNINFNGNGLELTSGGTSVQIFCEQNDWPAVLRVCDDLAMDFGRVTGVNGSVTLLSKDSASTLNASMIYNVTGVSNFSRAAAGPAGGTIIAGTMGSSSVIDKLSKEDKIDLSAIKGQWEAYSTTLVDNPMYGISQALVIAGSDRRGTIYGMYSVSEQIGVSPWYYFADSAPQKHSSIYATDTTVVQGSPSVKYRGFFLNDEAPALTGYIMAKFPPSPWGPGFNADFYHSVFELLLRLRANYLWPAQWNSMFNVDDPRNQPLADEYGIVMGTSHTEPMVRATKEWTVFGNGDWQWNTNNESIYPFFVEGAKRAKPYESVYTMGMRGSGDTALAPGIETDLLENVVAAQTQILDNIWGNASVQDPDIVPQSWCLYKEVQGYYEAGMRVPDYITLLWTDDNWGNNRRLPLHNETARKGGAGVYYHFDYVGDPRDYKWINTVQLQKTWEQMNLAYERKANRIWIVNVGDLKPLELPISHFMDLAYDITLWDKNSVPAWMEMWAAREFGTAVARQTAGLMNNYSIAAGRRKYELIDHTTFSLIDYNEADRMLEEWSRMHDSAQTIMQNLATNAKPAFFEMVYHPVTAGYVYYDIMISTARNNLHAQQGRNSANEVANHVLAKFKEDRQLTNEYNQQLDGKWAHMMDQTHIGYTYWQQPMRQATPGLQYVVPQEETLIGAMGVMIENSNATVPGDDMYHDLSSNILTMTPFDPYGVSSQWFEVFSTGTHPFDFTVTANATWVSFSQGSGTIQPDGKSDVRVWVTVDWDNCPPGSGHMVLVNITSSKHTATPYLRQTQYGTQYGMPQLMLPVNHTKVPSNFSNGYVESDGHITVEMEHWSSISTSNEAEYGIIPGLSRTLSGVTLFPVTAPSLTTSTAPMLEYKLYTFSDLSNGVVYPPNLLNITLVLTTSLNTIPERPLTYAMQFDKQDVQEVQYIIDQPDGATPLGWEDAVSNNAWYSTTNWTYVQPGEHRLRVWALEPGMVMNTAWINFGGIRDSYLGPPESVRV